MRILLAVVVLGHAIAHLPGFIAYLRLAELKDMPYKTTILAGAVNVGDIGIRVFGVLWLIAALVFVASGVGALARLTWWQSAMLAAAVFSLLLCILGWPDTRLGLLVNLVFIAFLLVNRQTGWLP